MKGLRSHGPRFAWGFAVAALGIVIVLACRTPVQRGDRLLQKERIDDAVEVLESAAREEPANDVNQLVLGSAHFRKAQRLLEAGDARGYVDAIERAQQAWLRALELDPNSPHAHNQLGLLATYRGDLEAARQSFELARQLRPDSFEPYINLAEIAIYRGNLRAAERYLEAARKLGAPTGPVELVEVLAAWRRGDLVEARDIFNGVRVIDPEAARTWNGGTSIESFRDMAEQCCRLDFCGPYMEQACRGERLPVIVKPERGVEVMTEEAALEAERQKAVRKVYEERRDIRVNSSEEDSLRAIEVLVLEDPNKQPAAAGKSKPATGSEPGGSDGSPK